MEFMDTQLPQEVSDLIERFERNQQSYLSSQYNEAQLRQEFINPFFEALGWDVSNEQGNAEAYKDVIHEDAIKIGSAVKAPDYCFRIGGTRKFFVEAKKPFVKIDDNSDAAFQLRRYAWSAKLPLGILTNFKEFAVYDCRIDPVKDDKASTARISYFTYKDYPTNWPELEGIFSKKAVLQGSFDKYAESSKLKKGTATVDEKFLKEIESWRSELAHKIALRNSKLTTRELNFAVQRTIDRIIFLRICEDRGMEQYGKLQSLLNGVNVYKRLFQLFQQADDRYNSGLFHFSRERDRQEEPDNLTPFLNIDDEPIKDIINRLYYPESPYEFSVLSADILGQVYEQFLGKVIRLTEGHHAKIEEKPEVRKAGGIYYTPTYIVDYIVKNTVGRLLGQAYESPPDKGDKGGLSPSLDAGTHPKDGSGQGAGLSAQAGIPSLNSPLIRGAGGVSSSSAGGPEGRVKGGKTNKKPITPKDASKLRILDPACGSGSFLIGAYQYLLDWHLDWYVKDGAEKYTKAARPILYQAGGTHAGHGSGGYRLTTYERKRILLNNIYGVDIDPQAVEVTKLSLLLKVLEGENSQTLDVQFKLFHERALPDLENNIKCGNSLIGPDFYQQQSLNLFNDDKLLRINAFDWNTEFADIMTSGGFDAVIGNPPYVRQEGLGEFKDYFEHHYKVFHGMADLYAYFIERGVSLLKHDGLFSYIVANKWMRANYGKPLRKWLKDQYIKEIIDFGDLPVFEKATTYPCIIRIKKGKPSASFHATNMTTLDFESLQVYVQEQQHPVQYDSLDDTGWSLSDERTQALLKKLKTQGIPLGEYVKGKIYYGIKTGLNEAFVIDSETRIHLIAEDPKSRELIKPFLFGRDIKRYTPSLSDRFLIFTRHGVDIKQYPAIESHLMEYKEQLMPRPKDWKGGEWKGRKPGAYKWYEIQDTIDYYAEFEKPKIMYAEIATQGQFTIDLNNQYSDTTSYILGSDSLFLLGILNSKLFTFLFSKTSSEIRGGFFRWKRQYMYPLTIPQTDISNPADKARHDKMVSLVDQMLSLNKKQLPTVKTDHEKTALQRQIDATDKQIDGLVYELYGITEEEEKIIEGK